MPTGPLPLLTEDCCSPLSGEPMDLAAAERLAGVLKALAEPTRLRLLSLIAAQPDSEACICDLTAPVGLSQPTVSHHMKELMNAGLIHSRREGQFTHFEIRREVLAAYTAELMRRVAGATEL